MEQEDPKELHQLIAQLQLPVEPAQEQPQLPVSGQPFESPTLATLDPGRRPHPETVCAVCPSSMWFASRDQLQCHCRIMHAVTWTSEDPQPITACDGPQL